MTEQSAKSRDLENRLCEFMTQHVYPNEEEYKRQLNGTENRFSRIPLMEDLKSRAKDEGLWNLFIHSEHAAYSDIGGLSNAEYAPLAEQMGRVLWSPEAFNCNAPDTGNMEVLMNFGTEEQKESWLAPLLRGEISSSYAMTEPQVASSDATNIELDIRLENDQWVLNGRKWFITGAMYDQTRILIVMGKSDPDNPDRHLQQSQILVPKDIPGLELVRPLTTLGYDDAPIGHAEIAFNDVRVPHSHILLGPGKGFEIAQSRLGPGRMHHCMRLVGAAQRALEMTCQRTKSRTTFGTPLHRNQSVREDISRSFSEIQMARLLILHTCQAMDERGAVNSRNLIAACKTSIPLMVQTILDRCIQIHGAGGLTEDYFMAEAFNYARWCRQADGPDQVHHMSLGKQIIERYSPTE